MEQKHQYLDFFRDEQTIRMRKIDLKLNASTAYEINLDQMPKQLMFIYPNVQNFYQNYLLKKPELVRIEKDELICRIPIEGLNSAQYPKITLKIIEKQQNIGQEIQKIKGRLKNLQAITSNFNDIQSAKTIQKEEVHDLKACIKELKQGESFLKKQAEQIKYSYKRSQLQLYKLSQRYQSLEQKYQELRNTMQIVKTEIVQKQKKQALLRNLFDSNKFVIVDNRRYYVAVFTVDTSFKVPQNMYCVVFLIGGGGSGGRGGTSRRGGGGSGYLQYYEGWLEKEEQIKIQIGEGGILSVSQDINLIERQKNDGKQTKFGDKAKAKGGETSGVLGTLVGGNGGSGGGAGQGSNSNNGAKGGSEGSSGQDAIYQGYSWKGGNGFSPSQYKKAQKYKLKAGKGGNGGPGNPNGHEAGGGAGGLIIPEQFYQKNNIKGDNGSGLYPGLGGEGFGAGGGGGSYDSSCYNYGGKGASGCVLLFSQINMT